MVKDAELDGFAAHLDFEEGGSIDNAVSFLNYHSVVWIRMTRAIYITRNDYN